MKTGLYKREDKKCVALPLSALTPLNTKVSLRENLRYFN